MHTICLVAILYIYPNGDIRIPGKPVAVSCQLSIIKQELNSRSNPRLRESDPHSRRLNSRTNSTVRTIPILSSSSSSSSYWPTLDAPDSRYPILFQLKRPSALSHSDAHGPVPVLMPPFRPPP